ncbi:phosphoglycerate mutase-like protein [Hypoxylon sp. FL1857]|nr:phosphoglycerate mutase-like protein [Hypoxylon sp. FL1857]
MEGTPPLLLHLIVFQSASFSLGHIHTFSYVLGFFEDYVEIANSSPDGKVLTQPALGIIKRDYNRSDADSAPIQEYLNREHVNDGISYKLIYVIRHGRGVHNVEMDALKLSEIEGQLKAIDGISLNWNNYWSRKDGNGEVVWADAQLVEEGILQAQSLAKLWLEEAKKDALPLPNTVYTSPLARCLETTKQVYSTVMAKHGRLLRPIIKEDLRERITNHTCDRRSSRSWIERNYPDYIIEDGLSELDRSWNADTSESFEQHTVRTQRLLDDIFLHDSSPIISLTTHSYTITSLLAVVKHPKFRVNEGTIVPLFVKAERVTSSADCISKVHGQ